MSSTPDDEDSPASALGPSPAQKRRATIAECKAGLYEPLSPTSSEATTVTTSVTNTEHEAAQTPVDDLPPTAMGNGLNRGRHKRGELPTPLSERIPLQERIRQLSQNSSSLHLEIPRLREERCCSGPGSASSLDSSDQDFRLSGLNGDIGLSKDLLCVPDSLQEVIFRTSVRFPNSVTSAFSQITNSTNLTHLPTTSFAIL